MEASRNSSNTGTTAIIIPQEQKAASLYLKGPHVQMHDNITSIFKMIKDSLLFSDEEETLNGWSSKLLEANFSLEEGRRSVCSFLLDYVRPKMNEEIDFEKQKMLLSTHNQVKGILHLALPQETDVDDFLEKYEDDIEEESFERESVEAMLAFQEETYRLEQEYTEIARVLSQPSVKIDFLLKQMKVFSLFPLAELQEWEFRLGQLEIEDQEKNSYNAFVFAVFFIKVIQAAIPAAIPDKKNLTILFLFEDLVKDILKNFLAKEMDVESFIEFAEQQIDDSLFNQEKTVKVNAFLREQMELAVRAESILRLHLTPEYKIVKLLEQMENSISFTGVESRLKEWKVKLLHLDFQTEEKRKKEDNGHLLCLFLFDLIRPALFAAERDEMKKALLGFEYQIRSILRLILPEDAIVARFIEQFEKYLDKEIVIREKFRLIQISFQKQHKDYIQSANAVNRSINKDCLILKGRLKEVKEMRKQMREDVYQQIDSLSERVVQLFEKSKETGEQICAIAEQMQSQKKEFEQLMHECDKILKKLAAS